MMRRVYSVSLDQSLDKYGAEIDYVLTEMERYYPLRRNRVGELGEVHLHYGGENNIANVVVPDLLFGKYTEIKKPGGVYINRNFISDLIKVRGGILPKSGDKNGLDGELTYDALGLAFLMLSRIEERNSVSTDHYGRYPATEAFAVRAGLNAIPLADRALDDIAKRLLQRSSPIHLSSYEVVPTHDVDILKGYHRLHQPLRYAFGDILKRNDPNSALNRLKAYGSGEPWGSFNQLMNLSNRYGFSSCFNFMGPSNNPIDSTYACLYPKLLKKVASHICSRGHKVGYHPGFDTYENAEEWNKQRQELETIIGRSVKEGRQHVLKFNVEITPKFWSDACMNVDYTMAFPEVSGFRTGSTRCFKAYDFYNRKALKVDLCATTVMEFGLFGGKYRDLEPEQALEECRPLIKECRRYGGRFVILQHTGITSEKIRNFYERLLSEAE